MVTLSVHLLTPHASCLHELSFVLMLAAFPPLQPFLTVVGPVLATRMRELNETELVHLHLHSPD